MKTDEQLENEYFGGDRDYRLVMALTRREAGIRAAQAAQRHIKYPSKGSLVTSNNMQARIDQFEAEVARIKELLAAG
jgi:hypothetical protein